MVFFLSALWWRRIRSLWKLPDVRDWVRGKLGVILMGGAMLSKSLIQFSVDGRAVFLPCCLTWGNTALPMATVTIHSFFGAQENKICHCFHFFLLYLPWSDGTWCHDLGFLMLSFKPAFSMSSRGSLVPLHFLPIEWCLSVRDCCYFPQQSWFQLVIHASQDFAWCSLHVS